MTVAVAGDQRLQVDLLAAWLAQEGFRPLKMTTSVASRIRSRQGASRVNDLRAAIVATPGPPCPHALGSIVRFSCIGVPAVAIVTSSDKAFWGECIHHGASAVVTTSHSAADFRLVLQRISSNSGDPGDPAHQELLDAWEQSRSRTEALRQRLNRLTTRESQVLCELGKGATVRDIARSSVVSEATVRTQVKAILGKLEVSSQVAAVGIAHTAGWLNHET